MYKFKGRRGDRYYWSRPAMGFGPAYEEIVSCDVEWFWNYRPCI